MNPVTIRFWILPHTELIGSWNQDNVLVTTSASELNLLSGSQSGSIVNNKAVIFGSDGEVNMSKLKINDEAVTSSVTELNILKGVISTKDEINLLSGANQGNVNNGKAVIYGAAGEINMSKLVWRR